MGLPKSLMSLMVFVLLHAMDKEATKNLMISILQEVAPDKDTADLDPDMPLAQQLSLDSMDFLDMGMVIRQRTGIKIKEKDFAHLTTLNHAACFLSQKLSQRST